MHWKRIPGAYFLLLVIYLFLSCKKEYSCEGCIGQNQPPVAEAGADQTISLPIDSIVLDGSQSTDPDGIITEWLWRKVSGPASFTIMQPNTSRTVVKNLIQGIYQFELKVTDDQSATSLDTVMITVEAATGNNLPPIAHAGNDTTIRLPANSGMLNGSLSYDPDNNITAYSWTRIAGPTSFTITNSNAVQTQVNNLVNGVYHFELLVTDAGGLTDRDTMILTVMEEPPCSVNAVSAPPCTNCKIVFVSGRDGNLEIYSANLDGTNITRLTNDAGVDDQPVWSPNDSLIAFASNRSGSYEIYTMKADGSNVTRKTFTGNCFSPSWSPDGSKIAYTIFSSGSWDIWILEAGIPGGAPWLLWSFPGYDDQAAWSPDGTKLAMVTDYQAYDIVVDIYTISPCGLGQTALTGNIIDSKDYFQPSWSPDGNKLAFIIKETTGVNQYTTKLGVVNSDGSNLTPLINGGDWESKTSWINDNSIIIYTTLSGSTKNISWVSADGLTSGLVLSNGWNADAQK